MPPIRLTQRRVDALRPRRKVRDIRDAELKGYGVRVMPSGARRYFIHSQHRGKRVWKIIGDAAATAEPEARARARSMLAALRDGREPDAADPGGTLFETVAEEVFDRYGRRWKPRTLEVNRVYLRRQILPFFAGRPIGEITREDVQAWFRGLHATPAAANRSAPILSVIMQQAEAWGYRPENSNPCAGIRRYRQGRSERFLTPEEYRRLAAVLGRHEASRPLHVAALRLLLLTGCRKSEILTLQWRSYREGRLYLPDSKTGPRTVWLCEAARGVLDRLPRSSGWVFPVAGRRTPWLWLDYFWRGVREEAGLQDVRLHDIRHSYASIALLCGESVRAVGRLLGHEKAATTLKYAHLSDATVREAVETLSPVLSGRRREGAEGPADRRGRRQVEATLDGIRGLGQRGVRPRRERGVRVRPSGHRSFVWHGRVQGEPVRATVGPAALMTVEDARKRALALSVGNAPRTAEGRSGAPLFRDFVQDEWLPAYRRRCAPSSCQFANRVLKGQLIPAFGRLPLDAIRRTDVERWFDAYSRTAPGGANKALGVLGQIMNAAFAAGHAGTAPVKGIAKNPRPKLTRFLSAEEIERLHRVLDRLVGERPSRRPQADIIRLLLLTGCRRGEILKLHWSEVDGDRLNLADSKTGPRRVWLSQAAQAILARQPRAASPYVFPSPRHPDKSLSHALCLWHRARKEAGLDDVRLHDLRHTFASQAVARGVPLSTVARMLGHADPG